jgi:hypothetical protein
VHFLKWFKEYFIAGKPSRNCHLILDGHTAHCNAFELLELADSHDSIILCLPSHTTQALQPLDRSFFKPLKTYWNLEAVTWMRIHRGRNITRMHVGEIIGKVASASVGT